jgi:hypothetical protein
MARRRGDGRSSATGTTNSSGDRVEGSEEELAERITQIVRSNERQDYQTMAPVMRELREATQKFISRRLEEPINQEIARLPSQTYEQKKSLAKWVNGELRDFGLAVSCPKTGHAAILRGVQGRYLGVGRFNIQLLGGQDTGRQTTLVSKELPSLALVPYDCSNQRFLADYWQNRLAQQADEGERER